MQTVQSVVSVQTPRPDPGRCHHEHMSETRLVPTGAAARALGIDRSTLTRWAAAGLAKPAVRTAGGHMRWDIEALRSQLEALQAAGGQKP